MLVIVDDSALPFGTLRVKAKGSPGGHNGLRNISDVLGTNNYPRLRFGIGDNFHKGFQVDYVLSDWSREEQKELPEKIDTCIEIIKSFGTIGTERTMNFFNTKKK
jgi:PTH1 family peptidyl-tRNA hydrolase